jgi:hypothetical protein
MFHMNISNGAILMFCMNMNNDSSQSLESFSPWTSVCGAILTRAGLAHVGVRQARMHPQSEGGSVLGLHSCRALSPGPRPQSAGKPGRCQLKT